MASRRSGSIDRRSIGDPDRSINFVELKQSHRSDLHQKLVNIDSLGRSLHKKLLLFSI